MGHPKLLTLNGSFRRCCPNSDKTRDGIGEDGAGNLPRGQSESGVQNGRNLNPFPVLLPERVDAGALPLLRADPVVEENQCNVIIARVSDTLPESARLRGSTK